MTVVELRESIIKKVAEDFNISLEQAKDLINSSFEIGEPEWFYGFPNWHHENIIGHGRWSNAG